MPDRELTMMIEAGHRAVNVGGGLAVGAGVTGWLTNNYVAFTSIAVLVGIVVGVTGLIVQINYQRRRDQREQAEHEKRMSGE